MSIADLFAARADGFDALKTRGRIFAQWWLSGLRDVIPSRWLEWANREASPRVTVWRDGDCAVCRTALAAGAIEARVPLQHFAMATLENWLIEHDIAREQAIIGLVIPPELFFVRELTVPKAAFGALPAILDQEVLRRTPFQLSEIWHEATISGEDANDVVAMRHWIIRKDRAEAALSELGLTSSAIDHLAISGTNGEAVPVITFRADQHDDPAWALRAVRLLAAAALGAALLGLGAFEWRQASVAGAVEASLAEARQDAQSGRDGLDPTTRLFAMKTEAGILDVWDELSRILPDHTFLTEVRLADGKVTLAGFSADAARLVRLIDQSPLFAGATLASAITPDANEHKDRFSIVFRLRGARVEKSPGSHQRAL